MTTSIIIPRLGELLRTIITRSGYRWYINSIGLDKDLDDLALESRASSSCDLLLTIEDAFLKELAIECGTKWSQFLNIVWIETRDTMQRLARDIDTSPLVVEQGREDVLRNVVIPMVSNFFQMAQSMQAGPITDDWWETPISTWIKWASVKASVNNELLLTNFANHLEVDQRTIDRWMNGEPMRELHWPLRPIVENSIGINASKNVGVNGIDLLTGWLVLAVTLQSLPTVFRDRIRRIYNLNNQHSWSLDQAINKLNEQSFVNRDRNALTSAIPLLNKIEKLVGSRPTDTSQIARCLDEFKYLISQETKFCQLSYRYIHDWLSAHLSAILGNETKALHLYESAVDSAWWIAGPNQHAILNESLLYAVGVGNKIAAERYWDKTFLLGLNNWPKRNLDEQERRRLAFGFEKLFYPQKAKDRILSNIEIIVRKDEFELGPKELGNPNMKVKHAEGRTRRTPLMDAIREGTVSDVIRLIDAGGNPNDFISESGESPLSYAMRRACDRKDPLIMEYLLELNLLSETVNRQASTMRETPLKIAIEMADFKAVKRLIELGAKVEAECDYLPSALCYAVSLLYSAVHRSDRTQEMAYLAGKGHPDVYDAKDGAVLDVDLAERRQVQLSLRNASLTNTKIFDAVMDYFIRPAEDYRKVIQVLLNHRADPNRKYKVDAKQLDEWTPTLFAAQIGDIEIFTTLVENGGNPDITLIHSSSLERLDALWIAITHGRHAIVNYLTKRAVS